MVCSLFWDSAGPDLKVRSPGPLDGKLRKALIAQRDAPGDLSLELKQGRWGIWGIACNIGALIARIGFCGPLYHNYNKEPPK